MVCTTGHSETPVLQPASPIYLKQQPAPPTTPPHQFVAMQDDLPEEAGAAICVTPPQSPVPAWDVTQHSSLQVLTPVAPRSPCRSQMDACVVVSSRGESTLDAPAATGRQLLHRLRRHQQTILQPSPSRDLRRLLHPSPPSSARSPEQCLRPCSRAFASSRSVPANKGRRRESCRDVAPGWRPLPGRAATRNAGHAKCS